MIVSLPEFGLKEDLFCWHKPKTLYLWTMATAQGAQNHEDKQDLS